jgi:flagellar biosynthetic protein FlhB
MAGGAQEKTEKPTGKKLGEARSKGQVPKSTELNAVSVLFIGGLTAYYSSQHIFKHFKLMIEELWGGGFSAFSGNLPDGTAFLNVLSHFFIMIGPTIAACLIAGVVINVIQVKGILFSFQTIQPKFSKLNPFPGIMRLVSARSLVELLKSTLKLLIVGHAVYKILRSEQELMMDLTDMDLVGILEVLGHLSYRILIDVSVTMLVLGLLDFYYQRWQHTRDLKMTKQEVKEESKQAEGNPQVKSRIRSIQFSLARKRMMANVPKASVVITNPTHFAVALLYDAGMEAPKVTAKGANHLALRIIEIARASRVPVVQNPPLARALYKQVNLDDTIPMTLYKAVAKVLAYIYQQKRRNQA